MHPLGLAWLGRAGLGCVRQTDRGLGLRGRPENRGGKNQPVDRIKTGRRCHANEIRLEVAAQKLAAGKKLDDESQRQPISVELVIERSVLIGRSAGPDG